MTNDRSSLPPIVDLPGSEQLSEAGRTFRDLTDSLRKSRTGGQPVEAIDPKEVRGRRATLRELYARVDKVLGDNANLDDIDDAVRKLGAELLGIQRLTLRTRIDPNSKR